MSNIDEEVAEEALQATEDYMREMTEIVMEHEVEDKYGALMTVNFGEIVQNMTTKEEDIIEFVNQFVDHMNKQKEDGELEPRSEFDDLQEARKGWEQMKQGDRDE